MTRLRSLPAVFRAFGLTVVFAALPVAAAEEILEGGGLKAVVNTDTGSIRIEAAGKVVVPALRLGNGSTFTKSEWVMVNEPLGAARALTLTYDNNRSVLLAIFPGHPFVCIRRQITNPDELDRDYTSETVAEAELDPAVAPAKLRSFGTGGLTPLEKNSGSYMYQAVVDPVDNSGVVAGWISSDRGSGVFFTPVESNKAVLKAVTEYGRLRLKPRSSEKGEWLTLGWFADARIGLEAYADAVADYHAIRLPTQPTGFCTGGLAPDAAEKDKKEAGNKRSSEKNGAGKKEADKPEPQPVFDLPALAAFNSKELKPYGFSFLRIDDQWQSGERRNGPGKDFTTARPDGPYPQGMKSVAESVKSQGLRAGLSLMPFAADHQDAGFKDKPDGFVKTADGKVFETEWGGSSLDLSQAATKEYVKSLVRTFIKDWGYDYLRFDGLYTGLGAGTAYVHQQYRDDGFGKQVFADPYQTPVQIYRSGLGLIREEAGSACYLHACGIARNLRTLGASYGLIHAMSAGPGNGATWKNGDAESAIVGPANGTRRWFFHNRVWHNDPGVTIVGPSITRDEARTLASWTAVSGQLYTHADWTPGLPAERLEILKRTMPPHGVTARPLDVFEHDPARIWVVKGPDNGPTVIAIFNWENKPLEFQLPLARCGLDAMGNYDGWEFWGNQPLSGVKGELPVKLAPHASVVISLTMRKDNPVVLSTSRHVLQSLFAHESETWDAAKKRLSATTATVGNDPCEIRILLPNEGKDWSDGSVTLAEADAAAGVRASLAREGKFVRLRLESPENRDIAWAIDW